MAQTKPHPKFDPDHTIYHMRGDPLWFSAVAKAATARSLAVSSYLRLAVMHLMASDGLIAGVNGHDANQVKMLSQDEKDAVVDVCTIKPPKPVLPKRKVGRPRKVMAAV